MPALTELLTIVTDKDLEAQEKLAGLFAGNIGRSHARTTGVPDRILDSVSIGFRPPSEQRAIDETLQAIHKFINQPVKDIDQETPQR